MINRYIFILLVVVFSNFCFGQDQVVIGHTKNIYSNILNEDRTYQDLFTGKL
jgi:hypothetical protein